MNVKELKELLNDYPDDQEVVLLDEARLGHEPYNVPCCVLSFWQ